MNEPEDIVQISVIVSEVLLPVAPEAIVGLLEAIAIREIRRLSISSLEIAEELLEAITALGFSCRLVDVEARIPWNR